MRNIPKKPKGKGKRWAKGHSCSSNPETSKFRDAAKSRFFRHEVGGPSALTIGALKTLDAFNNKKYGIGLKTSIKDEESIKETSTFDSWASSKTFKTFASDWSNCTNISFNKLLHKFEPNSLLHKEMLAVLAAITEVIKLNGGKETSTEYFGALITTLGVTEEEETVAAILSLLSMGIKSVPQEVLRLKFSEISRILLNLLEKYSELENAVILRSVIGCLSVTLRAQDPGIWSYQSTLQIFHSIMIFSTHSKPRVRKAGQHAVCAILKASSMFTSEEVHPAAATAAKYCLENLECGSGSGSSNTITLHILTLLKEIIGCFSKAYIKTTCETLLKLMTLGTAIVTSCSLEVLHNLFISAPSTHLDAFLNAKILNALYDYQPSVNDPQATVAWVTVMQEAHKALAKKDAALCCENLVKFFNTISNLWLCEKSYILQGATACLRSVIIDCFKACSHTPRYSQICQNIFGIVEKCLKYQFNNAWVHVFNIIGVLFEAIGSSGADYMGSALKLLGDLRQSHNFLYVSELDYTIGKAVRALGPEIVLKAIPVNVAEEAVNYEFKTSWILPILKENIQCSSLKFFIDYFLPMSAFCENKSKELTANNDKIGAHSYDLFRLQIWSLLPAFCNGSSDVKENFRVIARTLGNLIASHKHIRIHAMGALRKLIFRNQALNNSVNLQELSSYSKNYLPILFNLYLTKPIGTDESGERLAAYETIGVYLTITNEDLCGDLFDRALKRFEETDKEDSFLKESLMDLLKLLLPYQKNEKLRVIYDVCLNILKTTKIKKEEKKIFRLLEAIIGSQSENCKKFTEEKRKEIMSFLLKSIKNTKETSSRGVRLKCVFHAVKILPANQFHVIKALVPEAVLCCKDINKKTRAIAFRLLEEMFYISRTWTSKSNEDAIRDYVAIIIGGLAGTPTLTSATILALGKITQVLKTEIPSDIVEMMVQNICLLSGIAEREVVGSALDYIKIFMTSYHKDYVLPYVPSLVNALVTMVNDCKNHFRLKTRDILDRLIRKFSYDVIRPLIPEKEVIMQKRLKNLKRINAKKKAKRSDGEKDDESDNFSIKAKPKSIDEILASSDESENEQTDQVEDKKSKKKNKTDLFIQEDADTIVDLISPAASSKISSSIPVEKDIKKTKKSNDFKYTADGRMIIEDDSKEGVNEDDDLMTDEDLSDVDNLSSKMGSVIIGRKRKLSASSESFPKYQAGGSGIHRPLKKTAIINQNRLAKKKKKGGKNEIPNLKTGKEYRAKRAKGDIKLKGKPDPYAYIPLSRKMLNRRQKMKNIVRSAIKGAKMGAKLKIKMKKKKTKF